MFFRIYFDTDGPKSFPGSWDSEKVFRRKVVLVVIVCSLVGPPSAAGVTSVETGPNELRRPGVNISVGLLPRLLFVLVSFTHI